MPSALYVRETIDLSDATEQRLLAFARSSALTSADTLVVAARTMRAAPGYVLDLREPSDRGYLLNVVLLADTLDAEGLVIDMTGDAAATPAAVGLPARSARVVCRDLRHAVTVHADGGAGARGPDGRPGTDETFTIEFDSRGKPHREYEEPTPGQNGANGGAGGSGGNAEVLFSTGPQP